MSITTPSGTAKTPLSAANRRESVCHREVRTTSGPCARKRRGTMVGSNPELTAD
jgi:hypothetical protein